MICNIGISKPTEIKSKKKSIKRHNKLVRKERIAKAFRRRQSGGAKGRFVYNNNFFCMVNRALGANVVPLGTVVSSIHELKTEFAMEKPTDSVKYALQQYVFEENNV